MKKPFRRNSRRRRRKFDLMASNAGPWIVVLLIVLGVAGTGFIIWKFALPPILSVFGVNWSPRTVEQETPVPSSTPKPNPLLTADVTQIQKEVVPADEAKHISDPMRYGDEIIYTGGKDSTGPRNSKIYIYTISTGENKTLSNIEVENDDVFKPQLSENYMVWLDHKRNGGGYIKAMDKRSNQIFTVKEYYVGQPSIVLSDNFLSWTERTGSRMDKVFLYNLDTRENVCVDTLDGSSIFGMSDSHLGGNKLVWANYDTSTSEDPSNILGAIHSIPLDADGKKDMISTGMYVHDPMTNGKVYAWIDSNHAPSAKLYIWVDGKTTLVAEDVVGYGIGSNFVAYTSDEIMHVYFWETPAFDKVISHDGERCIFSGVSGDTVFWFDRFDTGISDRDVLKYAPING